MGSFNDSNKKITLFMTWKFRDKNAPTWNNGHPLSVYFWVAVISFATLLILIGYCFIRNLNRVSSQVSIIEQLQQGIEDAKINIAANCERIKSTKNLAMRQIRAQLSRISWVSTDSLEMTLDSISEESLEDSPGTSQRLSTFSNRPKRPQVPHTIYRLEESSRKL